MRFFKRFLKVENAEINDGHKMIERHVASEYPDTDGYERAEQAPYRKRLCSSSHIERKQNTIRERRVTRPHSAPERILPHSIATVAVTWRISDGP